MKQKRRLKAERDQAIVELERLRSGQPTYEEAIRNISDYAVSVERQRYVTLQEQTSRLTALLDGPHCEIHPRQIYGADEECLDCGRLACPGSEPLHFHHDGCPLCSAEETPPESQNA